MSPGESQIFIGMLDYNLEDIFTFLLLCAIFFILGQLIKVCVWHVGQLSRFMASRCT